MAKEKDTRKYYKCRQTGHIAKDCRTKQKMKNQSIQKDIDIKNKIRKRILEKIPSRHSMRDPYN